jgi:hypothetical protein
MLVSPEFLGSIPSLSASSEPFKCEALAFGAGEGSSAWREPTANSKTTRLANMIDAFAKKMVNQVLICVTLIAPLDLYVSGEFDGDRRPCRTPLLAGLWQF